jgi:hypothetical protein
MTKETMVLMDFEDILSLQLECLKCHAKYSRPIGNTAHFPLCCQSCGGSKEWFTNDQDPYRLIVTNLSNELRRMGDEIARALEGRNLKIRLEIKSSDSNPTTKL